jgi:hypothetical protein
LDTAPENQSLNCSERLFVVVPTQGENGPRGPLAKQIQKRFHFLTKPRKMAA